MATSLYEKDFALWAVDTADALRECRFNEVDVEHLVEEVEGLGRGGFCFWRIAFATRCHTVPLVKGCWRVARPAASK